MRALTAAVLSAIAAQQSGEDILFLLTITHADIGTIRLVNDLRDIVSGGNTFRACAFAVALPPEAPDGLPDVTAVVDNTDLSIGFALSAIQPRSLRPEVTLQVIAASAPNTVVATAVYGITQIAEGGPSITLTLDAEPLLDEPFPGEMFTPDRFPSMFVGD